MSRSTTKLLGPVGPRYGEWGELGEFLLKAFPKCRDKHGRLSVDKLCITLKLSYEGIYRWLRRGYFPSRWARIIPEKSKGRVTFEECLKFVRF